jgi:hypothetical protein
LLSVEILSGRSDPLCCDTIIRRYERVTGEKARREASGETMTNAAEYHLEGALTWAVSLQALATQGQPK